MCVPKMRKHVWLSIKRATTLNYMNDHDMLVSIGRVMMQTEMFFEDQIEI